MRKHENMDGPGHFVTSAPRFLCGLWSLRGIAGIVNCENINKSVLEGVSSKRIYGIEFLGVWCLFDQSSRCRSQITSGSFLK